MSKEFTAIQRRHNRISDKNRTDRFKIHSSGYSSLYITVVNPSIGTYVYSFSAGSSAAQFCLRSRCEIFFFLISAPPDITYFSAITIEM